jgi:hypothetical protein
MIGQQLGVTYAMKLADTRRRLQSEDASFAETGAWRARLDDLLQSRPDLTPRILQLIEETSSRLPH